MKIKINNQQIELPVDVTTVEELLKWRGIPTQGTAIAVNNKLLLACNWGTTKLNESDLLTVISAAFGG